MDFLIHSYSSTFTNMPIFALSANSGNFSVRLAYDLAVDLKEVENGGFSNE